MRKKSLPLGRYAYLSIIYLFFYLPIAILIIYSFNNAQYSMLWHGFTLTWYHQLWQDSDLWLAVVNSLIVGILAASIASVIGVLAAVCLYRYRFFGKKLLHGLLFILIVAPDMVMGTSLLILYNMVKMPLGFWSLLLAHITFCIPFVAVTVYSRITSIDKNIFEAAKDLGASDLMTFIRITVPLLLPAILAGWLLSFTLSLDDVIISYFVTGPTFQILPLTIYSMVRLGVNPIINALSAILFGVTLLLVLISQLLLKKRIK